MYYVSLKQFEGPLDLLLHLITRAKVDIKDIFVSEITEQYLASMGSVDELDMDTASEFLTMAATLLEIKSRALLPRPPEPAEDGEETPVYQTAEDGLGDTVKPRLMEAEADLERVLVIDDRDTPLTLADERIARAIRENNARLVIIDPMQAFLGADVDMNRANEVRPIFRSLGDIAQATGCAIVLIGHLNKAAGTQSTYRGLGSIDITAAVRSLLFIGKLKDSPTTRVLVHEKSSLAPPGESLAFSLGDEKGFEWIGAYDITADELLAGTDTAKTESKTAQAQMLILELLADGKRMPSAELEKAVNERGISSRTMRTAKSRIGDRLVTEKDGTAWVCYLRN